MNSKTLLFICLILFNLAPRPTLAGEPPTAPVFTIETGFHSAQISKIAVDAANRHLVSVSLDKTVRVWSLPDLKLQKVILPPIGVETEGQLLSVAISKDGRQIVAAGHTGFQWDASYCIYIFDRESGNLVQRITNLPTPVLHIAYSPDGRHLGVSLANRGVRLYETSNWKLVGRDTEYSKRTLSLDFDHKGRMVSAGEDGIIRLYEIKQDDKNSLKLLMSKPAPGGGKQASAVFSPDDSMIAIGYDNPYRVDILSADDLSLLSTPYEGDKSKNFLELQSVAWSSDGKNLYAGGRRGKEGEKLIVRWSLTRNSLPVTSDLRGSGNRKRKKEDHASYYLIPVPFGSRIQQIMPLTEGRMIFATADPGIGILDDNNQIIGSVKSSVPDFIGIKDSFQISESGDVIRFGYEKFGNGKAIYSFQNRGFILADEVGDNALKPPETDAGIGVTNWNNKPDPALNGAPLKIDGKYARSLAISPDKASFLLGVDNKVYRFDKTGKIIWKKILSGGAFGINISGNGRMFVVAVGDGTIRWFNMDTAAEVVALFPHPDMKRWITWCPEGYYDASPGAEDMIGYQLNQGKDKAGRIVPNSQLYDVFYRPDIIQAKIRGDDISGLITITAEDALKNPPPIVSFTKVPSSSGNSSEKICYRAVSTGGGIGEIRLFQNGKLVKSDGFYREAVKKEPVRKVQLATLNSRAIHQEQRSLTVRDKKTAEAPAMKPKADLVDECIEIEPVSGVNEIGLAAFNAPNTVQSFMGTATFHSTRQAEEPHLYVLSVGIDNYFDSTINLKYAAKDATDFIARLPEKARSIYKPENIHLVTLTNMQATKQQIMTSIDDLATKVRHGDGFIFFNASHGVLLQNQYYIITADFNGDLNNVGSLISSNEIIDISKKIKSLSQLIIFDTCHAGGVDNIVSGLYDARMSVMAKKMGLHIYASAGSVQTAMDGYKGNGLYTHTLLQGLSDGKAVDTEKSGRVTVKSLGRYTKEKTTDISTKLGQPQTPFIINFGRDNPLFIVK